MSEYLAESSPDRREGGKRLEEPFALSLSLSPRPNCFELKSGDSGEGKEVTVMHAAPESERESNKRETGGGQAYGGGRKVKGETAGGGGGESFIARDSSAGEEEDAQGCFLPPPLPPPPPPVPPPPFCPGERRREGRDE